MTRQRDQQPDDPTVAAIERVLRAERDGEQQLRSVRERAERTIAVARVEAAAIARRGDSRISKLRSAYLQKIEQNVLKVAESSVSLGDDPFDRPALAEAAQRLAARLTGAT